MQGLFSEFPSSTYADWVKQVIKDLKGESPEHLVWENENGFKVKPYSSKDESPGIYEPAFLHRDWQVCVEHIGTAKEMNANFLRDLRHGANAIAFEVNESTFDEVLNNIQIDLIALNLSIGANHGPALKKFLDTHYKGKALNISLYPVSFANEKELKEWKAVQALFAEYQGVKTTAVNACAFTAKNALPYYELALAFTQMIETLSRSGPDELKKDIVLRTSTDSDFFVQVAKLRAYRRMWKLIGAEYNISSQLYIVVETDINNLSISDAYTNLLRTTLSSMSAILGGCNELMVQRYDRLLSPDKAFSSRMAMNQQFILKHESYFDKMGDVACGAYYIEGLTDALCERALETIKSIESKGGYFNYLETGEMAKELEKQNKTKMEAISSGKLVRIGVNIFKNEKEELQLTQNQLKLLKTLAPHHPLLNYELLQNLKA